MNRDKLTELLVTAGYAERQAILAQHASLVDAGLAWSLKAFYDHAESSNPALAARTAEVLTALAETTTEAKTTGEAEIAAVAAWTNGMVALDAGQTETALRYLDASENGFLALDQSARAAATLVSKLRALAILGRFEEALQCGVRARDVFISHGDLLSAGKIEQNLGNIYFLLDRYLEAEHLYRTARQRFETADDQKQLAQVENCLATALTSQHRFREAEAIYEQALTRSEKADLKVTLAEIETNLGCLALFQGHYDQALDYLERARRRFTALDMQPWSVTADQELADAYLELNLIPEAAVIYERVIPIFSKLGMQTEQARALAYLGRARLALGQNNAARPLLAEAMALYKAAGNPVGEAMVILFEAQAHYAEGNYAAAGAAAAQTETPFANVNAWGRLLMARWLQGEAHRAQGDLREAEKRLKETLAEAERWVALPVIHRCHTSLGLIAEERGDLAAAESAFQRAIALIEGSRTPLPAEPRLIDRPRRPAMPSAINSGLTNRCRASQSRRATCRTLSPLIPSPAGTVAASSSPRLTRSTASLDRRQDCTSMLSSFSAASSLRTVTSPLRYFNSTPDPIVTWATLLNEFQYQNPTAAARASAASTASR